MAKPSRPNRRTETGLSRTRPPVQRAPLRGDRSREALETLGEDGAGTGQIEAEMAFSALPIAAARREPHPARFLEEARQWLLARSLASLREDGAEIEPSEIASLQRRYGDFRQPRRQKIEGIEEVLSEVGRSSSSQGPPPR